MPKTDKGFGFRPQSMTSAERREAFFIGIISMVLVTLGGAAIVYLLVWGWRSFT